MEQFVYLFTSWQTLLPLTQVSDITNKNGMESQVKNKNIRLLKKKKSDSKFVDITFSIFPWDNWNTLCFLLL